MLIIYIVQSVAYYVFKNNICCGLKRYKNSVELTDELLCKR